MDDNKLVPGPICANERVQRSSIWTRIRRGCTLLIGGMHAALGLIGGVYAIYSIYDYYYNTEIEEEKVEIVMTRKIQRKALFES